MSITRFGARRKLVATGLACLAVPAVSVSAAAPHATEVSTAPSATRTVASHDVAAADARPGRASDALRSTPGPSARVVLRDYTRQVIDLPAHNSPAPGVTSPGGPSASTPSAGGRTPAHRKASSRTPAHPKHTQPSGHRVSSIAYSVLNQLNAQRREHGRPALHMNATLIVSAHRHNLAMAQANEMSHQLPGESYFADRIRAAGYSYRYAGENIGWNSNTSTAGALALGTMMYAEGPGGAHWENIVDPHFTDVGIDVYIDSTHHKLWLTEDFGCR